MERIYLDHNATTPVRGEVIDEMARCLALGLANPASAHHSGRRARRLLEEARHGVAALLGVDLSSRVFDRVIFTSGGTEANNLAVLGIAHSRKSTWDGQTPPETPSPNHLVVSAIEHASVVGPVERLLDEGWRVDSLPAARDGKLRCERLGELLCETTKLFTATMANHETGVRQPIAEMAATCNAAGVLMHTDAAQMAGKLPINFRELGVAAMSISAHKFSGPPGVGALVLRSDVDLEPLFFGGEQQYALRPGTESIALARGLWTALRLACEEQQDTAARLERLRLRFEQGLRSRLMNIEIHGAEAVRLPPTVSVAFPGLEAATLFKALDKAGVECALGSACTSGSEEPSPTLLAMGISTALVKSSLRFSLGMTTSEQEVDQAIQRIAWVCKSARSGPAI